MFYLDFWYFFFVFYLRNKTLYGKNVSGNIYFENSMEHSGTFLTRRKPLTGGVTNFVQ